MNTPCDYCGMPATLVGGDIIYPHRPDLAPKSFWWCKPCDAYVGCHEKGARVPGHGVSDGTLPLGRLATADLRQWKRKAHDAFDPLWKCLTNWQNHPAFDPKLKHPGARRRALYRWLANELCISEDECHVGMFDIERCQKVIDLCRTPKIKARL